MTKNILKGEKMPYYIKEQSNLEFIELLSATEKALSDNGFGIITRIDFKETFKKKIDKDIESYIVLGACKPDLAYTAVTAEIDIGLLLPCNVAVYEKEGKCYVSVIDPNKVLGLSKNEDLSGLSESVMGSLRNVLDAVKG